MTVVAVDTGNRLIKTAHAEPFSAGLNRHLDVPPIVATDTLFFEGNYYSFSESQGFHRQDKTVDDYYFILTLAAIARELVMKDAIRRAGNASVDFKTAMRSAEREKISFNEDIFLSIGLPPSDMKILSEKFKRYFMRDGSALSYTYNNIRFNVSIKDVCVSAQGFAAIFPNDIFNEVTKAPQTYIIDIGGYTLDIARIVNRRPDPGFFKSLDYGVIHLYNEVAAIIREEFSVNINGIQIEAALRHESIGSADIEKMVRKVADTYARRIVAALQDNGIDLKLSLPVLMGGGAKLMQDSLEKAINRSDIIVLPDIRANAVGYEVFANRLLKERRRAAR